MSRSNIRIAAAATMFCALAVASPVALSKSSASPLMKRDVLNVRSFKLWTNLAAGREPFSTQSFPLLIFARTILT